MYTLTRISLVIVCILVATAPSSIAATTFNLGIGPVIAMADTGHHNLLGVMAVGTLKNDFQVLSARYVRCMEVRIPLGFGGASGANEYDQDVALMVGLSTKYSGRASATIEAGIGFASRIRSIEEVSDFFRGYHKVSTSAVGLAVQSQLYARRVGFLIFSNINRSQSFWGFAICVRLGRCN